MKILIVLLLLVACVTKITYVVPPEVKDFIPKDRIAYSSVPDIYKQWWREIGDCAHIKNKKLELISWYSVPRDPKFTSFDCYITYCWGYWRFSHEIYIVQYRELDEHLVKHEMLHDLLGQRNVFSRDFMKHHKLFKKCKVE